MSTSTEPTSSMPSFKIHAENENIGLVALRTSDSKYGELQLSHFFEVDVLQDKLETHGQLPSSKLAIAKTWITTVLIDGVNGGVNFGGADACAMVALITIFGLSTTQQTTSGQQFLLAIAGFLAGLFMGKGHTSRATSFSEKAKTYLPSFEFVNKRHSPLYDFLTNNLTLLVAFELALIGMKHLPLPTIIDPVLTSFAGMSLTSIVTYLSKSMCPEIYALRHRRARVAMSQEEVAVRKTLKLHALMSDAGRIAAREGNIISWGKGYAAGVSNFAMVYLAPIISQALQKSGRWSAGNIRAVNGVTGIGILAVGWFFATDALIPLLKLIEGATKSDESDDDMFV